MPRPSPLRHPLAVLRGIVGWSQKEAADKIGKSAPTIQAIELGKLKMSDGIATLISHETGVSIGWLLGGDPSIPPYPADAPSQVFGKDAFDARRVLLNREATGDHKQEMLAALKRAPGLFQIISRILALSVIGNNVPLAVYRLEEFTQKLYDEFGYERSRGMSVKEGFLVEALEAAGFDPDVKIAPGAVRRMVEVKRQRKTKK